jgi:6-phosphofructokinase 1
VLDEALVDLRRETPTVLEELRRTPSAALGSCRFPLSDDDCARALDVLRRHNVRYFIYIGGNDSADTSHRLAGMAAAEGYELRAISVPKTIDNDLPVTDHCPGYGSIARFVATATRDAGRDTEAMYHVDPIKIVEVMGRNAGWVAAASALAKADERDAPHLIYTPERPLSPERFLADVAAVRERFGFAVIVVSETVSDEKGNPIGSVAASFSHDPFGHPYITNAAAALSDLVTQKLGYRARWDKPGTIQRMSMALASEVDLAEAYLAGRKAVEYAVQGHNDRMVVLLREPGEDYRCNTGLAPLETIANQVKLLPPHFLNAEGNFVTPAFLDYARPLVGGSFAHYPRLQMVPVSPTALRDAR